MMTTKAHNHKQENRSWLTNPWLLGLTPATFALVGVLLLAAALNFTNNEAIGPSNQYYTAAVESMLDSWDNFFFVAAEPGGSVSVDKPPLGLWIETISAAIFGVSGFATVLPNILAGFGAILIIYHLVKTRYGAAAGLIAALVLVVTPVAIAAQRNNTADGMLTFAVVVAAWGFLKAAETDRLRYLWFGALFVGLGFMIKMLQAYLLLPALFAVYFLGANVGMGQKIRNLAIAGGIVLVVSLWWPLAVDLTPAAARPYVGSSTNNRVMDLIIGHNGAARLLGAGSRGGNGRPANPTRQGLTPPGFDEAAAELGITTAELIAAVGIPPDVARGARELGIPAEQLAALLPGPPDTQGGPVGAGPPAGQNSLRDNTPAGPPGGAPGGSEEVGNPGPLRFFAAPLSKEVSWLLPFALVGMLVFGVGSRPTWPAGRDHLVLVLFGGWLATGLVFFSIAGFFHAYYLIMLAPPLGVLVGVTAVRLQENRSRWAVWLLIVAVGGTIAFQWFNAGQFTDVGWWLTAAVGLFIVGSAMRLGTSARRQQLGFAVLLAALLLTPTAWSWLTNQHSNNNALPGAYDGVTTAAAEQTPRQGSARSVDAELTAFLIENTKDVDYLVAVPSAMLGAPLVLETKRPVLYMGGFNGGDPVVDTTEIAAMVAAGELRYLLLDKGLPGRGIQSELQSWVLSNCTAVREEAEGRVLYDCTAAPDG